MPATLDLDRRFYLPRLPREYYQGDSVIHWTLPIAHRKRGWLTQAFRLSFRELMLHCAARHAVLCPVYCLMPDHLHLAWMGLRLETDQLNAMAFLRTHLEPRLGDTKFQHQAHDHVLKQKERQRNAFARACRYILENPVKDKLVADRSAWLFNGTVTPGYPRLHPDNEDFWRLFWKIYAEMKSPDAGNIRRPPINPP